MNKIKASLENNELYLYGNIGEFEISAKSIIEQIALLNTQELVKVRINSNGGDVAQGIAIFNALKALPLCDVYIDGIAASIASVISMAGNTVYMAPNAVMMIHKPWTNIAGDSEQLKKSSEILEKFEQILIQIYVDKTGKPHEVISEMLNTETWFTAQEALEHGFIDAINDQIPSELESSIFDLTVFNSVPFKISKSAEQHNELSHYLELCREAGIKTEKLQPHQNNGLKNIQAALMSNLGKNVSPTVSGACIVSTAEQTQNFLNDATDAILIRNGIKLNNPTSNIKDLVKYSITDLAGKFLALNGVTQMHMSKQEILNKALSIHASHSSGDFAHLLGNAAGKSLALAYQDEYSTHEIWTGETEVVDFKEHSLIRLSEAPDLDLVKEGGEYKHGSFSENAERFKIEKYGKQFSITYEALINDDLGAFIRLPQAFGKSAKRKESDLVYQVLTTSPKMADGKNLFHADHGNLASVAGGALNVDSLHQARLLMRKQKGIASNAPLNIVPRFLIVPAALETVGEQLLNSLVDPSKNNDTPNMDFIRNLILVVDSRLDDASESICYLAADPSQIDTITRAYLAGSDRPHYETKQGWDVDCVSVKARLELAAVPIDYRGLVKLDLS